VLELHAEDDACKQSAMMWGNPMMPYAQQQQAMIQQQAMLAAQQAYQQSMYAAMSMAGSQAGDADGRTTSPMPVGAPYPSMNPGVMGYSGMPSFMPQYGMMGGGSPMMTPYMPSFPPSTAGFGPGPGSEIGQGPRSRMSSYNTGQQPVQEQRTGSPMRQTEHGRSSPRPHIS
jgi:CCR4-NOT transcriptional complex subunit CAF120